MPLLVGGGATTAVAGNIGPAGVALGPTVNVAGGAPEFATGIGTINVEDTLVRFTAPVEGGFVVPGAPASTLTLTFAGAAAPIFLVLAATTGTTTGFAQSDVTFTGASITLDLTSWTWGASSTLTLLVNPYTPPQEAAAAAVTYYPYIKAQTDVILRYYTFGSYPLLPETVTSATGQVLPNPLIANEAIARLLGAQADAGTLSLQQALDAIVDLADGTTGLAVLNYQFFTGKAPTREGLDYLVSSPQNPNDLNDGFYAGMSAESRYINFAVNLGTVGEGRANFQAQYGALSINDATAKAYAEIFGVAPTPAKVAAILTPARLSYFSSLGGDALGQKAAMVGFLLAEAAKSDAGPYAVMSENFLYDLADGTAGYGADLHIYLGAGPSYVGAVPIPV